MNIFINLHPSIYIAFPSNSNSNISQNVLQDISTDLNNMRSFMSQIQLINILTPPCTHTIKRNTQPFNSVAFGTSVHVLAK